MNALLQVLPTAPKQEGVLLFLERPTRPCIVELPSFAKQPPLVEGEMCAIHHFSARWWQVPQPPAE